MNFKLFEPFFLYKFMAVGHSKLYFLLEKRLSLLLTVNFYFPTRWPNRNFPWAQSRIWGRIHGVRTYLEIYKLHNMSRFLFVQFIILTGIKNLYWLKLLYIFWTTYEKKNADPVLHWLIVLLDYMNDTF